MKKKLNLFVFISVFVFLVFLSLQNALNTYAQTENLIANPSVETALNENMPRDWLKNHWGSNNASFGYLNNGQSGHKSVFVSITKYKSGDAKWYFKPIAVKPSSDYTFSDYYKSNVQTQLMAQYTSSDNTISYTWLASETKSASWKQVLISFTTPANSVKVSIFHVLNTIGTLQTDTFSLTPKDISITPSATPTPLPTNISLQLVSPLNNAILSHTVSLQVSIVGTIKSLQYQINNVNIGPLLTSVPFSYNWDTSNIADNVYTLTAIATDEQDNHFLAPPITVTIQNDLHNPHNSIPNPDVENSSAANLNLPADWHEDQAGNNTAVFSYLNTGNSGSRSLSIQIASYTNGADDFSYTPQPVLPNTQYVYNDFYESNVNTELDAEFFLSDGTAVYQYLNTVWPSPTWNHFAVTFTTPMNVISAVIYHSIYAVGYLTTDNFSLLPYNPSLTGFNRGIVSLTFDDNRLDQLTNALPLLDLYGLKSTMYIPTTSIAQSGSMSLTQLMTFANDGDEIASHTITHPHLPTLSESDLNNELSQSQQTLQQDLNTAVTDFASPYGEYNDQVIAAIKKYYQTHRSTDVGFNAKNNLNPYNLVVQNVNADVSASQVEAWVQQAIQQKLWLILVYHDIVPTGSGDAWSTTPANLATELQYIHQSGIAVETIHQAIQETITQAQL